MFLWRSNKRVKYLHGSFIRKICASNSRSFQWVTLYELDSIKISSGFQTAIIVQGSSAAQVLVLAPGWCCFSWQLSVYGVCGSAQPLSSQTLQISSGESFMAVGKATKATQDKVIQTKDSRKRSPGWHGTSVQSGQASGRTKDGLKGPSCSKAPNLFELQVVWQRKLFHWAHLHISLERVLLSKSLT